MGMCTTTIEPGTYDLGEVVDGDWKNEADMLDFYCRYDGPSVGAETEE